MFKCFSNTRLSLRYLSLINLLYVTCILSFAKDDPHYYESDSLIKAMRITNFNKNILSVFYKNLKIYQLI